MELAIGATIIAGVIILIVMLMAWGNSTALLGRHYRVVVNMTNVGGLKEGAPVKMGGFQIGRVASIQIKPGSTEMEIVLDIDENRILPKGSTAKVSTAGLVGDAFMEIVPGKSADTIKRATTVADAERLESSPLPDMSELMTKVNDFGEQLNILTANLNDIVGDLQFRKALKSMAVNIDNVSYQANLILQRSQSVVDNIELASQNVAVLSNTLKDSVEKVTDDIERITDSAIDIADTTKLTIKDVQTTIGSANELIVTVKNKAEGTIDNINGGIADVRNAINSTLGNPEVAANLSSAIANVNSVTALLAKRNDATEQLILNLSELSNDLKAVTAHVRTITGKIEPDSVSSTLNSLSSAINSMTDMVEKVKSEPVLALSINKAADRIVKMKFDEMAKQQYRTSDNVLKEINRWVAENMNKGYFTDPSYSYEVRPYAMPGVAPSQTTGDSATERRPYMVDR